MSKGMCGLSPKLVTTICDLIDGPTYGFTMVSQSPWERFADPYRIRFLRKYSSIVRQKFVELSLKTPSSQEWEEFEDLVLLVGRHASVYSPVVEALVRDHYKNKQESTPMKVKGKCYHHPPTRADFIFDLFMDPKSAEPTIGDLHEMYRNRLKRYGKGGADFWYWVQILKSLTPIISAWTKRISKIGAVVGIIHKLATLELWHKLGW